MAMDVLGVVLIQCKIRIAHINAVPVPSGGIAVMKASGKQRALRRRRRCSADMAYGWMGVRDIGWQRMIQMGSKSQKENFKCHGWRDGSVYISLCSKGILIEAFGWRKVKSQVHQGFNSPERELVSRPFAYSSQPYFTSDGNLVHFRFEISKEREFPKKAS